MTTAPPALLDAVPTVLRERAQWVLWRNENSIKKPYQTCGKLAKSNDPATWTTFDAVNAVYTRGGFSGVGFVLADDDPFVGIDLDSCRNPQTGAIADWAKEIMREVDSYTELSPSGTGYKIWVQATFNGSNCKHALDEVPLGSKAAAIEMFARGQYFTVTGARACNHPADVLPRQDIVDALLTKYWPARVIATSPVLVGADSTSPKAGSLPEVAERLCAGRSEDSPVVQAAKARLWTLLGRAQQ